MTIIPNEVTRQAVERYHARMSGNSILRNKVPVKIKRLHPDAVIPRYATELSAGFDLVAVEDIIIEPGETALIRTGIAVQLPEGYEMQIRPRSGISKKTKLRVSNSPGTIDADYRGEVGVLIDNIAQKEYKVEYDIDYDYDGNASISNYRLLTESGITFDVNGDDSMIRYGANPHGTYIIRKGDRIAQVVVCEAPKAEFIVVDSLDETERGAGGFGSTGVKGAE